MNEGWATFWHYTILNHLYDEGKVTERFMLEFLHSHTNVVFQPPYNSPRIAELTLCARLCHVPDIKRICQSPTDEDKYWFPDIAGSDWLETLHFAMRDFKDESFISQFLSPKVMRDFVSSRYLMMTGIIIWRSPPFITKKVIGRFDQNCRHSIT